MKVSLALRMVGPATEHLDGANRSLGRSRRRSPTLMLKFPPLDVPLSESETGAIFVQGAEVRLEDLIAQFERGDNLDAIAARCNLRLSQIYCVLAYYLDHRKEVEEYLARETNPKGAALSA